MPRSEREVSLPLSPVSVPVRLPWTRDAARTLLRWICGALVALGFVVAYGLDPLYKSNQHERFLHAIAESGFGYLRYDWQANTFDPLPSSATSSR